MRSAATLPTDLHGLVDVVEVDQGDHDGVVADTAGVEALFWVNPPTADADPIATHLRVGRVAARAVEAQGIPRTVFVSSAGAELRSGAGEIDGLGRTEDLLDAAVAATGTSVTHLRCGFFFTNVLKDLPAIREDGVWRTPWPPDAAMPWVAPRDIAEVAAGRLLSRAWSGRVVQAVHGPEDVTFARAAVIVGRAIGRTVRVEHLDQDTFRGSLRSAGLPEGQVAAIAGMSAGLSDGYAPADTRDVLTTTPTTLAAWLATELDPVGRASPPPADAGGEATTTLDL